MAHRLAIVARFRRALARRATAVASSLGEARPLADTLTAEILPLLEAARYLERRAGALLAPRRLGESGRPLWLAGTDQIVLREPWGAILILAPSNYPIMLPGIQALQALVAGNAVAWKPGRGGAPASRAIGALLVEAGLPPDLLDVTADDDETGRSLAASGFDRIVLTGSAATGRGVLAAAAANLTPCTMELSGADPVYVLPGADLELVAGCLLYGLRLNGGATCIAPRRVLAGAATLARLEPMLLNGLTAIPPVRVPPPALAALRFLAREAVSRGARPLRAIPEPDASSMAPLVLADCPHDLALLCRDIFAPWLALVPVPSPAHAADIERSSPLSLGASIFGPTRPAAAFAAGLAAGATTINDLIVPTADPRIAFGGAGGSGFGVTRGPEGLLDMTRPRSISIRRPRGFRPHLKPGDPGQLARLIALLHG